MNKTKRKCKTCANKTKKIKQSSICDLTGEQKNIFCSNGSNNYESFEQKIEDVFKKHNIDISSTSYNLGKSVVNDLRKAVNLSNVHPNNDYYSYINDRWLSNIRVEKTQTYIVQVDDIRLVQDKVYRELIGIIELYINDPKTKNTKLGKCIKNAYESFNKYNTLEQTRSFSKVLVNYLDTFIKSNKNIWVKLAQINNNELTSWGSPFVWSINPDEKNPTVYKCYIDAPSLSLLDIEVYYDYPTDTIDVKKYKKKYRNEYFIYLKKLFKIALGENHGFNIKDIYNCEIELLNAMTCDIIKQEDANRYNLITKDDALKHFGFDWETFCKALGFKNVPDNFVTSNPNYLLCCSALLKKKWMTSEWKAYWVYINIRQLCRWNKEGRENFINFNEKFMRGQQAGLDSDITSIFGMGFLFNTFLTNQYNNKYKNISAINYVSKLSTDLKIVFKRIIKRVSWMEKKTKEFALEKLENLKFIIGSSNDLIEDPLLDYVDNDPWGNILQMALWRNKLAISLVGKHVIDIPVVDWTQSPPKFVSFQSYLVNAMYTPTKNAIYIPLGYIQKPFVDLDERGIEYNLSNIGFAISHEMSHALDDVGSKYNKDGKLQDWWSKRDKQQFKKIQEDVVKQYNTYLLRDGIKFDAWPSIGEDIADISGFSICQEYLRDFQLKNKDILPIQDLSFKSFFVYFALHMRQKISKKSILSQLKSNPHPLNKYRCNIPLSRSKIFRAIYNVTKNDNMWWKNDNKIWSN